MVDFWKLYWQNNTLTSCIKCINMFILKSKFNEPLFLIWICETSRNSRSIYNVAYLRHDYCDVMGAVSEAIFTAKFAISLSRPTLLNRKKQLSGHNALSYWLDIKYCVCGAFLFVLPLSLIMETKRRDIKFWLGNPILGGTNMAHVTIDLCWVTAQDSYNDCRVFIELSTCKAKRGTKRGVGGARPSPPLV